MVVSCNMIPSEYELDEMRVKRVRWVCLDRQVLEKALRRWAMWCPIGNSVFVGCVLVNSVHEQGNECRVRVDVRALKQRNHQANCAMDSKISGVRNVGDLCEADPKSIEGKGTAVRRSKFASQLDPRRDRTLKFYNTLNVHR